MSSRLTQLYGRLILYDSSGKSGGISAKAFDRIYHLLIQAANTLRDCPCTDGCPSCALLLPYFCSRRPN